MSKPVKGPADRLLTCPNCGISFLWSAEEQSHTNPATLESPTPDPLPPPNQAPQLCPGCRLLLPPAGYERGLVKWFNRRRQYGFITRKAGADLFVHASAIQGRRWLNPGELVEFLVGETAKGPAAMEVRGLTIDE